MKRTTFGIAIVTSFLWASYSFAVFCPPVSGDNTQNLRNCIAQASVTDFTVILGDFCEVDPTGHYISLPGRYPISDQVVVLTDVEILGSRTYWGSTIEVNFGSPYSNTDNSHAAIVLKEGAAIDGVTFDYPIQTKGKQLIEVPPSISVQGSFCRVKNMFFPNSYVGIDATAPHGRLNMENLEFGVYYRGIRDDQCYDIDKLNIIHANTGLWATWTDDSEVTNWVYNNSATIEVSRIDWLYINTFFAFGPKYGILINSSKNGTVGDAQIIQAGCDACQYGIYSNLTGNSWPWLIAISNFSGTSFNPIGGKGDGTSIYLVHVHGVNISNSNFWGVRNDGIYLEDCSSVSVSGNTFADNGWNSARNHSAAIHLVNCRRASVVGNTGTSNDGTSYAVRIEGGSNISIFANQFEVPGASVSIEGATNVTALGNGCVQDFGNDPTNRIDVSCSGDPAYTPTPMSTRTPTPTPTPTRNPGDPTPTPTPTVLPTRIPKEKPGLPLK
jgi:parallel beta-helix repeat protein